MKKAIRHGEIALVQIQKLPEGLIKSDSKVLMTGSHGNSHSFDKGTLYPRIEGEYVFGYLEANSTTLLHSEHGEKSGDKIKKAKISDGFYQLRKQHEHTPSGLLPVID
jgi:hypothetical protein